MLSDSIAYLAYKRKREVHASVQATEKGGIYANPRSEETRQLRFHFVWKREDGLDHAIEKLNRFESLNVRLEEGKIIVE